MKQILRYLRPFTTKMSIGLVIKVVGTAMDLLLPWMLAYMLDTIVPTGKENEILLFGFFMLLAAVAGLIGNVVANRMASAVARDCAKKIRHDLFDKCMQLSCRQVDVVTVPSLETRLTSDTYNIHQMIGMMQRMGVRAPILLLGGIVCSLLLEPALALVMIAVLPLITVAVFYISKQGTKLYRAVQQATDGMVRKVRQISKGIRVIKAFSTESKEKDGFSQLNEQVSNEETRAGRAMARSNPLMTILLNLGLTAVIAVGAVLVNAGNTEVGKIIAFLTYFTLISNAMLTVTRIFVMYSKSAASAARISEILDMEQDLAPVIDDQCYNDHAISFENVSFAYNTQVKNSVEGVSFAMEKGQTLGIIGATGSGKSTIIRLLLRLYDCQGRICVDGRDIKSIAPLALHNRFACVLQNDFLFSGTVFENICFGRDLTEQQVQKALRVCCADFVFEDADGLNKRLTPKGTNLSGGQRQRLLIARAVAGDPEFLILDDASSALDYKTDAVIRKNLKAKNTTSIVIAQRISSVLHADQILVLDAGEEIALGTHTELLASCPLYKEISLSQMGGALLE